DMTPMVDLAFLLLTFFIMTTTLMKQAAMEIQQPIPDASGRHQEGKSEQVLNLVLGKNNAVHWYIGVRGSQTHTTDYSASGLRQLLVQKKREIKNLYVFIKASDQSRYKNVIDVLDEIQITRTANYALLDLDPDDK